MPEISADSDYRDLAAQSLAAANRANRASDARTRCENKVVQDFGAAR